MKRKLGAPLGFALGFALMTLTSGLGSAAPGDTGPIRLVAADRAGVTFEVNASNLRLIPTAGADAGFVEVDIPGFTRGGNEFEPGLPELLVWIGIPEGVEVRVQGTVIEAEAIDGVRIQPLLPRQQPAPEDLASGAVPTRVAEPLPLNRHTESETYRASSLADPVAELAYITGMRSQRVAAIRVRPALYDGATGRLLINKQFRVDVQFGGRPKSYGGVGAEPAFEDIYRSMILNYESAKEFRRSMGAVASERSVFRTTQTEIIDFNAASTWLRVQVRVKGLQRILGRDLESAGVNLGEINSNQLRLFTRAGVPILDEDTYCDTCGLTETGLRVVDGGDGRFDSNDYLLFYGLDASGWRDEYLVVGDTTETGWLDHPYENNNFYWLTWNANLGSAPKRWVSRDVSPTDANAWEAPFYQGRTHSEQNFIYRPNMYEPNFAWDQWAWQEFNDGIGTQLLRFDTWGAVTNEPARLLVRFWGISQESIKTFGVDDHVLDTWINDIPLERKNWNRRDRKDLDTTLVWVKSDTSNALKYAAIRQFDPRNPGRFDQQSLLFVDAHYKSRFRPDRDVASFTSPDTSGVAVGYGVGPFSTSGAPSLVFVDVSEPNTPIQLSGFVTRDTTGGKAVYFHDAVNGGKRYFCASDSRMVRPGIERTDIRDIRAASQSADYVIITYDGFEAEAQRLADHRGTHLAGFSNPTTQVIRMSDILAWYSGGRMDPTAIRNFIYDITVNDRWSPKPSYFCFLGDASYDFKNTFGFSPPGVPAALVPTYVHGFEVRQFLSDDWLVDIDLGPIDPPPSDTTIGSQYHNLPDFLVGRLPATNSAEATLLIEEKIIPYDAEPNFGEWRNRALFVADDLQQGFSSDPLGGVHMVQTDSLEGGHTPDHIDRKKVYLVEYPFGVGSDKPAAKVDIIKRINEGVLLWNYVGHGNPFQMADENAFVVSDIPSLTNMDELTLCIAASCDLGKFDDPTVLGMGEALIKSPLGGSVATFSASEIAFAGANFSLTTAYFDGLFARPYEGYPNTLGQAIYYAKYRRVPRVNDRKYTLQGDPGTRLGYPDLDVRMAVYDDETGETLNDSLARGRRIRIEGEVHGSRDPGVTNLRADFNGTALIEVTDSAPIDSFKVFPSNNSHTYYTSNPGTIFRGEATVKGGRLTTRFYVPMESVLGDFAKARIYVLNEFEDGVGSRAQALMSGTPSVVDTSGPDVLLRFARGTDVVPPEAELLITLSDEHGINITGHAAPNRILLTINDETREDLTEKFRYDANSYTQGTISFRLPNLPAGNHRVHVRASDNFAQGILARKNQGEGELEFTVSQQADQPLASVMNFPNPFPPTVGTQVILNGVREFSDIEIKIYTVTGELIRSLRTSDGPGQVQVGWDGRDEAGGRVSMGVYLYRVQVRPLSGGQTVHLEGRMAAAH
jgi:hypothetical protein